MSAHLAVGPPPLPILGEPWSARVASVEHDAPLIQRWMTEPHVARFWRQDWPLPRWRDEIARQRAGTHSLPCLVALDGADLAYVEVYRVARDRLADYVTHDAHDLGVHLAIGQQRRTGRGHGTALLAALADGLLAADAACRRIVAEPDAGNGASLTAFRRAGFVPGETVVLPDKTAVVLTYERRRP
ncbi:GNAT family N-acetyltransferase [Saccharomonospora piscinae]|uniref:Lysine N-acyltransferase MbtK n=1 Tax=Saccharomonospora piscinae TaxID=687388 RepID=A0A1V9ADB9_SACPI|nr:GNAT family N-acetyltransferase [Saccharomonospora piscinae]OQO95081.1 GNAT family N-acetyltransferase [Saccharomonospora piscinae]